MKIRIRGWHTTQKKMYSPEEMATDQLTLLPTGSFINVSGDFTSRSQIYPPDKFIPLLSTGLLDKNGKEIWEGDIVLDHGYQGIVKYGTLKRLGFHGVFYLDLSEGGGTGGDVMFDKDLDLEVIGNIWESPELLTTKE